MTTRRPDPHLTAAWLRELIENTGVRKPNAKWDLSDRALARLTVQLAVKAFHHQYPPSPLPGMAVFYDDSGQLAAQALRENLAQRHRSALLAIDHLKDGLIYDADVQVQRFRSLATRIERALASIGEIESLVKPTKSRTQPHNYRHHAISLAAEFVRRYRQCNPGTSIGLATEGPVVGYVVAVTPYITGEKPTRGAVGTFLKNARDEVLGVIKSETKATGR